MWFLYLLIGVSSALEIYSSAQFLDKLSCQVCESALHAVNHPDTDYSPHFNIRVIAACRYTAHTYSQQVYCTEILSHYSTTLAVHKKTGINESVSCMYMGCSEKLEVKPIVAPTPFVLKKDTASEQNIYVVIFGTMVGYLSFRYVLLRALLR